MCRIGAREGIDHVQALLRGQVVDDLLPQPVEVRLVERHVRVAPPDPLLGPRLANDELVLRRAAGELSRVDDERPALGEPAVTPAKRVGVELRRGRVAEHLAGRVDLVALEPHLGRRRGHPVEKLLGQARPGGQRVQMQRET